MRKTLIGSLLLAAGMLAVQAGSAQAPAGAPAGSTALCNDGTYFKGSVKIGACTGHKGVKQWWGAPPKSASTPAPATASKPASAPASTPAPAASSKPSTPASTPAASSKTSTAAAPGGGPDKVWVNTSSNVYHCPGSQYYGKTKAGSYMSEADAKAKGAHPAQGKPCK